MLLKDAETAAEDPAAGGEQGRGGTAGGTGPGSLQARRKKKEVEKPQTRTTKADEEGDMASLNRLLSRVLYLVVKNEDGKWTFPTSSLEGNEWLSKVRKLSLCRLHEQR